MVRCFEDENVIHVSGSVDPLRDIEIINLELGLSDIAQIEKRRERLQKQIRTNKEAQLEDAALERMNLSLQEGGAARNVALTDEERLLVKPLGLLTSKPIVYASNLSEDEIAIGNVYSTKVNDYAGSEGAQSIKISAQVESELIDLGEQERFDYLNDLGVKEGGLQSLIRASYDLLG